MSNANGQNIINNAPNMGAQGIFYGPVNIYQPRPVAPPSLHQLRALTSDFIGREQEIVRVATIIEAAAGQSATAAICCIRGMGGVGKTELAYAAAHRLKPLFPDGQIVVSLASAGATPLTPTFALQRIIQAFIPDTPLPDELDALESLYRSLLTGKRILVLADDASSAAQVRPLRPPPGSALLLTSRNRFGLPGMQFINLAPLPAEKARDLLVSIYPDLASAAPDIAKLCGYLPLALRLAASLLVNEETLDLDNYLHLLGDMRTRLAALRDPDEPALGVEATLQLSYARLGLQAQLALCRLSLFTAPCNKEAAAAIVTGGNLDAVEPLLGELQRRSLLNYNNLPQPIQLHDLVRVFAMARLEDQARADTQRDFIHYYLALVEQAEPELIGANQQLWFLRLDQEYEHIRAALRYAHEAGDNEVLLRLAGGIWRFWEGRGYLTEGREWLAAALAERGSGGLDTPKALLRVQVLTGVGALAQAQGQFEQARVAFEESLILHKTYGEAKDLVRALNNLGQICLHQNDLDAAERHFSQCLELLRVMDEPWLSGIVLCHLGIVSHDRGALDRAIFYYEQGLARLSETGDEVSQAMFLDNQGHALLHIGDLSAAQSKFEASLAIRARMEDPWGLASAQEGLGLIALAQQDTEAAAMRFRDSLARYRDLGADEGMIWAIEGLARVAEAQAQYDQAARLLGAAHAARQQLDIPLPVPEQAEYRHLEERLRTRLTELHYISIITTARSLTLQQIADEAYGGSA